MLLHPLHKILGGVPGECTGAKPGVLGDEVLARLVRVEIDVGEVTAPTAGDANLFGNFLCVVNQHHVQSLLLGNASTKKTRRSSSNDQDIGFIHGSFVDFCE